MTALRRRIHTVAIVWLLCQVASLSAFVPGECCKAHAAEAAAKANEAACHETTPAPAPKEGDACPMHSGSKSHDCCTISNGCAGPGQQLTTLFAHIGVVQSPQSVPLTIESSATHTAPAAPLRCHLELPDSPPPKS
jgi:hypothetical protein